MDEHVDHAPATSEDASAIPEFTDTDIAAMLAPDRLRFRPYDIVRHGYVVSGIAREPSTDAPPAPPRPPPARRFGALCLIIANPCRMMLALARELAAGSHGEAYVHSLRHWSDGRWTFGHGEIRDAPRASLTRFRFFEALRAGNAILALPPPEPG